MISKAIKGARIILTDISRIFLREASFYTVRPNLATIFLTYRCNSRCKTCSMWKLPAKETEEKEIGLSEWKRIVDALCDAGIMNVELFGGNVLLRKSLLIDILYYLKDKGVKVFLPTNQIGLDEEVASAINDCVDTVYISTDGTGQYQDLIRGQEGASKRSKNTVSMLLKLRGSNSRPGLVCNTTVSRHNIDLLEGLVEYAMAADFDEIHFEYAGEFTREHIANSVVEGVTPSPYYVKQDDTILADQAGARLLKRKLDDMKRKYSGRGLNISTVNIDILSEKDLYNGTIPCGKCYVERTEVTIDPSGNVIICPFINNYILGSLLSSSFNEVWNNTRHKKFRRAQNRGDLEMCNHCILSAQRNPGVFSSLMRIYYTRVLTYRYKRAREKAACACVKNA